MLTNKTRKGLSWAASIALATASFVGISAPANAVSGVVEPKGGTSTTFVAGELFELRLTGTYTSTVSWEVSVPAGYEADYALASGSWTSTASGKVRLSQAGAGTVAGNTLKFKKVDTTSAAVVTVRAFTEANGDAGWQSGEVTATPVEVSFIKRADLTPTIAIDAPLEGDLDVTGSVKFNINNEQLNRSSLSATIAYADGSNIDTFGSTTSATVGVTTAAWSTTKNVFTFGQNASAVAGVSVSALVKAKAVSVRYSFDGTALGAAATTAVVSARSVGEYTVSGVVSQNLALSASGVVKSRLNSEFSFEIEAVDTTLASTTASAVANASVTIAVDTTATMSGTATTKQSLTVNGTEYTDKTKLPGKTGVDKISAKTNAAGKVVVTLKTANFVAADTISFTVQVENLTAQTFTVHQLDAAYAAFLSENVNGLTNVVKGTSAIKVLVRDQFGGSPADGKFQVKAIYDSNTGRTTAATANSGNVQSVVGGAATLSIVDDGAGAGTSTYDLKLVELKPLSSDVVTEFSADFPVAYTATALTAGTLTVTGSGVAQNSTTKVYTKTVTAGVTLSATSLFAHDGRTAFVAAPEVSSVNGADFNGTVSSEVNALSAGTALGGVAVTVTGPADALIQFTNTGTNKVVYGLGSVTGYTNKNGGYAFSVFSNTSGKKTLTIAAGSATATLVIDSFRAAGAQSATSLVVDAPAYVDGGSTFVAKIKLTDKYGNAVQTNPSSGSTASIKVTYTGPGLRVGDLPTNTDAEGAATVAYFLGSNDTGTITVKVQYDKDNDGDFTDADTLTVTKTTTIGKAPAAPAAAKLTVGSFKGFLAIYASGYEGKKLSYKVAGKWGSVASLKAFERVVRKTGAGYTVKVDLYVDGSLVKSETVTTK